jgi:hypothetical protein
LRLLIRRWELWDVDDVEALCGSVIERSGLELDYYDREDLLAYLLALIWELSLKWDPPAKYRHKGFAVWAATTLKRRVVDWDRSRKGRTKWKFAGGVVYERTLPQLVSLDAGDGTRLDEALAGSGLDGDASGFASDMRALDKRARRPGRRDEWMGDEAA